jgi:hypothetical protein
MVLLTLAPIYCIGDVNIKKISEIALLVLSVCISFPISGTGSFPPIYWCNWHQCVGGTVSSAPLVETYAQKLKKLLVL